MKWLDIPNVKGWYLAVPVTEAHQSRYRFDNDLALMACLIPGESMKYQYPGYKWRYLLLDLNNLEGVNQ